MKMKRLRIPRPCFRHLATRNPFRKRSENVSSNRDSKQTAATHKCDLQKFASVIDKLQIDRIPAFASNVRQIGHSSTCSLHENKEEELVKCQVLPTPSFGSFNVTYTIAFDDDTRWIIRVPADGHGDQWSKDAAENMKREVLTMQLIKRRTSIPIPKIYAFDTSLGE